MPDTLSRPDPWAALRAHTPARIALGRSGGSLPTAEVLRFGMSHARARDAVHTPLDVAALHASLQLHGFETVDVHSAAPDRASYLQRPDLGRCLDGPSRERLLQRPAPGSLVFVAGDGLSATAVQRHALPLLLELRAQLEHAGLSTGPVVLARQARVALGDEIGQRMAAAAVVVLIGERPGLSSPDSLGAYITWAPHVGCLDADRNCVSNIRPEGLPCPAAARKIAWLVAAARGLGATGVRLKDESGAAVLADVAWAKEPGLAEDGSREWTRPT